MVWGFTVSGLGRRFKGLYVVRLKYKKSLHISALYQVYFSLGVTGFRCKSARFTGN